MNNKDSDTVRIDIWLWAARIYKTRTLATDACRGGKVRICGQSVKPSRIIRRGETVVVRREGIEWSYLVVELLWKRVGAKDVSNYRKDCTSDDELRKLTIRKLLPVFRRERGAGRPTKKERRVLDEFRFFDT